MKLVAQDIGRENAAEWDRFAAAQPRHNAFQSARLLLALQDNRVYRPFGRLFRDSTSGTIVAGYVFHVIAEVSGPAAFLATRAIVNGGPLATPEAAECYDEIIEDLRRHPGLRGIYVEVWHAEDRPALNTALEKAGFAFSEHLNYHLDLRQPMETLWGAISKRRRQYIRNNQQRLVIREVASEEDFGAFFGQLQGTYSRVNVPLVSPEVFKTCWRAGAGWFLLIEHESQVIASRVVLPFGKTIYDWYAGSDPSFANLHANESLVWQVLERGQQEGYHWFDFGGAGKPGKPYGPREFKSKFGGQLVNYGRHRLVLSKPRAAVLKAVLAVRERWFDRSTRRNDG